MFFLDKISQDEISVGLLVVLFGILSKIYLT